MWLTHKDVVMAATDASRVATAHDYYVSSVSGERFALNEPRWCGPDGEPLGLSPVVACGATTFACRTVRYGVTPPHSASIRSSASRWAKAGLRLFRASGAAV